jgi:glutamine synthetase
LRHQLEKAHHLGYTFNVGVEPEFMLLRKADNGSYVLSDPLDVLLKPCYDLVTLHRSFDVMTTLIRYIQQLGWHPIANDHEDGNCQFEINWRFADALTTADRHTYFRWMVRIVGERLGLFATFMPKPFLRCPSLGIRQAI